MTARHRQKAPQRVTRGARQAPATVPANGSAKAAQPDPRPLLTLALDAAVGVAGWGAFGWLFLTYFAVV